MIKKLIIFIFFSVCIFTNSDFPAVAANNDNLSFEFKRCSITEALHEVSLKTGVDIIAPFDYLNDKMINKLYTDSHIELIIKDIFKGQNHTVIWGYKNNQLVSVDVQLAGIVELTKISESQHVIKNRFSGSRSTNTDNTRFAKSSPEFFSHNSIKSKVDISVPPPPDPEKFRGIETPPMPPGLPNMNFSTQINQTKTNLKRLNGR